MISETEDRSKYESLSGAVSAIWTARKLRLAEELRSCHVRIETPSEIAQGFSSQ